MTGPRSSGHEGGQRARIALREATREVHERLHGAAPFAALAQGRLDLPGYARLLGRLAAYYRTLAPGLEIDPARMELLAADLDAVKAPVPPLARWTPPASAAQKLGWQYVVEGSIFGGRVIHRQLDYLFGSAQAGRRFFAGCSGATGRWQALCGKLERAGANPRGMAEMTAGALAAFALFEEMLHAEPAPA